MKAQDEVQDASAAYRLWDEFFGYCMRMALSTVNGTREEKAEARERLARANESAFKERDVIWERILRRMGEQRGGRRGK